MMPCRLRRVPALVTVGLATLAALAVIAPLAAQYPPPSTVDPLHRSYDQLLDIHVRDGLVYYRALRGSRGGFDRYVASLDVPTAEYDGWDRPRQIAFWLNAYNAVVLRTVVDAYPIRGRSSEYPAASIRQIPGAFERAKHRLAGRSVTLDEIAKTILPEFKDPRVHIALGRGAIGSGRLRSEAYTASRLESQLASVQAEFVNHQEMLKIDRLTGQIAVTPIISWHEAEFVAAYDKGAEGPNAARSPIERAIVAFIAPNLLRLERQFVEENTFKVVFQRFDWRLNDLSGGQGR